MKNINIFGDEKADGDLPADQITTSIIKVACILIIGVVILTNVVIAANITEDSLFYNLMQSVESNINSGYMLAALMVLSLSAGGILYFLGFM